MHPYSAGTAFKRPSFEALQREAAQLGAKKVARDRAFAPCA